jgi:hypothetical protein
MLLRRPTSSSALARPATADGTPQATMSDRAQQPTYAPYAPYVSHAQQGHSAQQGGHTLLRHSQSLPHAPPRGRSAAPARGKSSAIVSPPPPAGEALFPGPLPGSAGAAFSPRTPRMANVLGGESAADVRIGARYSHSVLWRAFDPPTLGRPAVALGHRGMHRRSQSV